MAPTEWIIVCVIISVQTVLSSDQQLKCKRNFEFYNDDLGKCLECSPCGENEVIRTPCSGDKDTLCGPFFEFRKFHQSPYINLVPLKNSTQTGPGEVIGIDVSVSGGSHDGTKRPKNSPVTLKTEKWYILAMSLLGILSVIAMFVVAYIAVVCFCRRRRGGEKEVIYDPGKKLFNDKRVGGGV